MLHCMGLQSWTWFSDQIKIISLYNFLSFEEAERRKGIKYKFTVLFLLTFFFPFCIPFVSVCGFKLPSTVFSSTCICSAIQLYCLLCAASVKYCPATVGQQQLELIVKQQLELGMGQQTGFKLGKEYVKAVYCHPTYLIYMQSTSCEMLG